MKYNRILTLLLTFIMLLSTASVYAKDIALDVIEGDHDYLMFATVSDIDEGYITAEFYDTLNKTEDEIPLSVKIEKFRYSYCPEHGDSFNNPKIGDNIFVVLDKSENGYSASVAYKTDTVDSRTLNLLVPSDMENNDCMTDVAAIAYLIRNGSANISFAFVDDTVSILRDKQETVIYPTDAKNPVAIKYVTGEGKAKNTGKAQDVIAVNPVLPEAASYYKDLLMGKRIVALGIVLIGLISGMIVMYLSNKRKRG